uniref:Fibulin-1 n=1 Tax=Scophthalmus maximus TaxID=52904 RepID=A0A8D3D335_SCOMX
MAHWSLLLVSLCGVVHAQETQPLTLPECCREGSAAGQRGQDCEILRPISDSYPCRIAQVQCCAATAADKHCRSGVKMAQMQGPCETVFFEAHFRELQIAKMCCVCCTLGLTAPAHGLSCELQGLSLGKRCESVARTCCDKNTTEEARPNAEDSTCSQLRAANDTCACHDGYQLQSDKVNCEDINECLTDSHNCISGQTCINTEGSFRCQRETSCGTGYELTDSNGCRDIDECALGSHNCGPDFTCNNTAGSFRCRPRERCDAGFIQDAVGNCNDINECVAHTGPCHPGHTCINTMGSYTCRRNTVTCGRGYHLTEDGTRCEDVDECRAGNVCGNHGCVNLVGSYRCECRIGFVFNSITKLCDDINECWHYPGRLCAHKCENTEGSYQCICTIGFKLSDDGRNCDDINECEMNPCSQECSNVYGSYQCYCRHGFQLSDIDGISCEDIDECGLPAGSHVCSYSCTNAPGSFLCTCPPTGYTLGPNGRTCQDIDECAAGTHTCSLSESCFNIQGGFHCLSFRCPQNFQQAAQGQDNSVNLRCVKACQPGDPVCAVDPINLITYSALSLPTFRDFRGPEEIIFLRTSVAAHPAPLPGGTDVFFEIVDPDEQFHDCFVVVKHFHQGKIIGVVQQVKPITGPRVIVLKVAMNYYVSGHFSHCKIVVGHILFSEFWF